MKVGLVVVVVILAIVILLALGANREQRYSVVLLGGVDWTTGDVRRPHNSSPLGVLIGAARIPHRYKFVGERYKLEVVVDAADYNYPVSFQIQASGGDGQVLALTGSWPGPCGWLRKVSMTKDWQHLFTEPTALGFIWAPGVFCSETDEESMAANASKQPIRLAVMDENGVVLGEEVINFEIKPNGVRLYYVTL